MNESLINYTELLPRGAAKKIHKSFKSKISLRQVQRIIAGTSPDNYGILDLVIEEAKEYKKMRDRQIKETLKLNQSSSTPKQK